MRIKEMIVKQILLSCTEGMEKSMEIKDTDVRV